MYTIGIENKLCPACGHEMKVNIWGTKKQYCDVTCKNDDHDVWFLYKNNNKFPKTIVIRVSSDPLIRFLFRFNDQKVIIHAFKDADRSVPPKRYYLEYFEPNLSDYDALLNKLKMYVMLL